MSPESPVPETPPAPTTQEEWNLAFRTELRIQQELLKKINGKLAFFVFLVILYFIITFFGSILSLGIGF